MSQESDWKKFRNITTKARVRYLTEQNTLLLKILTDPERNETERFWDTLKRMKEVGKILSDCLDDNSRSRMEIHMRLMLHFRMLVQEDLDGFSDELQTRLRSAE